MNNDDLLDFIQGQHSKPWADLSGTEKSEITKHLHELGQAGA